MHSYYISNMFSGILECEIGWIFVVLNVLWKIFLRTLSRDNHDICFKDLELISYVSLSLSLLSLVSLVKSKVLGKNLKLPMVYFFVIMKLPVAMKKWWWRSWWHFCIFFWSIRIFDYVPLYLPPCYQESPRKNKILGKSRNFSYGKFMVQTWLVYP